MATWNSQTTRTDITAFSDNPKLRRALKIWRLKIAAWVIAGLLVLGFSARPAYRAFREYRINQNLAAAQAAARLEDWSTARDKARSVLLARLQDFEAYRIWTRALGKMGEARTYMAAAQLFTDSRATREDRLEALQVMALQAPQAVALSAYASLPEELRKQASFRAAITPLLVMRGEIALAEKGLREVAQPTDEPKVRLELLRVLCSRPDATRVTEARQILADLIAARADAEALDALLILGETPGGLALGEPLPDLPKWLKDQPKATALHHLIGMHPALEALPETAERQYESAIERFLSTEPGVLGTWLVRHGKAEMVVGLLEEPAKTRSDAYLARLHALLRLKNDVAIVAAMAAPPDSVDLVEIEIVRAGLSWRRSDAGGSKAAWTMALNRAAYDSTRNRFIEIARAAERFGAKASTEDAWVAAVRSGWGQVPLYRDLVPIFGSLAGQGRTEDLLAMYRTLLRFEPRNSELRNNFNYLALLHGIMPPEEVATQQAKLVDEQAERPEFNSALMLAKMMGGHPADALDLLPKLRDSSGVAPMMRTALEGTARVLAGETEAGAALLKQVNWRLFMRQERIVFRDMLVKLKISEIPLPEPEVSIAEIDPDQIPAWRKAIEQSEKDRATDVLPPPAATQDSRCRAHHHPSRKSLRVPGGARQAVSRAVER
ncbi:MAG: hypothetical protein NTW21_31865 [Verrucomicrobia bacterium]|nr:hypothetical protein [Verrucomicrobiota bacterium]